LYLGPGSSLDLIVTALLNVDSHIVDTIELVVDYQKQFFAEIRLGTDEPIIQVSDINFGDLVATSYGEQRRGVIRNIGKSNLVVTGYDESKMNGTNNFFNPQTDNWQPLENAFPAVLAESDSLVFWVFYAPMGEIAEHIDSVAFYSNAVMEDSICIFNGRGVLTSGMDNGVAQHSLHVRLSPLPISTTAIIELEQAVQSPVTMTILDILGRRYELYAGYPQRGTLTYPADFSAYGPGSYVLQVSNSEDMHAIPFVIVR
jgi:hypothetical protein